MLVYKVQHQGSHLAHYYMQMEVDGEMIPVLKSNDYTLEEGEKSVFDQELKRK